MKEPTYILHDFIDYPLESPRIWIGFSYPEFVRVTFPELSLAGKNVKSPRLLSCLSLLLGSLFAIELTLYLFGWPQHVHPYLGLFFSLIGFGAFLTIRRAARND